VTGYEHGNQTSNAKNHQREAKGAVPNIKKLDLPRDIRKPASITQEANEYRQAAGEDHAFNHDFNPRCAIKLAKCQPKRIRVYIEDGDRKQSLSKEKSRTATSFKFL
jgi:hypothetical protein